MNSELLVPDGYTDDLRQHLFQRGAKVEQAAFLFTRAITIEGQLMFDLLDDERLTEADFVHRYSDYIEITDEARVRVIKKAVALGASIFEAHSHLGPYPAEFSDADREGLRETAPYMSWRLGHKPYGALVFAWGSVDALVWPTAKSKPASLAAIADGTIRILPTNRSLEGW